MIENWLISKRDLQWPSLSSVFTRNVAIFKGIQCTLNQCCRLSVALAGCRWQPSVLGLKLLTPAVGYSKGKSKASSPPIVQFKGWGAWGWASRAGPWLVPDPWM
jgi:hypothetical protein